MAGMCMHGSLSRRARRPPLALSGALYVLRLAATRWHCPGRDIAAFRHAGPPTVSGISNPATAGASWLVCVYPWGFFSSAPVLRTGDPLEGSILAGTPSNLAGGPWFPLAGVMVGAERVGDGYLAGYGGGCGRVNVYLVFAAARFELQPAPIGRWSRGESLIFFPRPARYPAQPRVPRSWSTRRIAEGGTGTSLPWALAEAHPNNALQCRIGLPADAASGCSIDPGRQHRLPHRSAVPSTLTAVLLGGRSASPSPPEGPPADPILIGAASAWAVADDQLLRLENLFKLTKSARFQYGEHRS